MKNSLSIYNTVLKIRVRDAGHGSFVRFTRVLVLPTMERWSQVGIRFARNHKRGHFTVERHRGWEKSSSRFHE